MKKLFFLYYLLFLLLNVSCKKQYDEINGQIMQNNFERLENLNDSTVINWIKNQNVKAENVLHKLPDVEELVNKQKRYGQSKKFRVNNIKFTNNNRYFYLKSNSDEKTTKLYCRDSLNGKEILVFDPNNYKKAEADYLINYFKPNWDGTLVAISLEKNGNEFSEIVFYDLKKKELLKDLLKNASPSSLSGGIGWMSDNRTVIYDYIPVTAYDDDNVLKNTKVVRYTVGSYKDVVEIFSKENNPQIPIESEDFPHVFILNQFPQYAISTVAGATPYYDAYSTSISDFSNYKKKWKGLFKKNDKIRRFNIIGDTIYYLSAKGTPNFHIGKTLISNPVLNSNSIIIPEKKNEIIKYFLNTDFGLLYAAVINGVQAKLYSYSEGIEKEIILPRPSADIKLYKKGKDIIVAIKGWLSSTERYVYNHTDNNLEKIDLFPEVSSSKSNFDDLVVEELNVKSHDGEEVPLSLVYKKGTKFDGSNPVLMRAYGSYGSSMVPNAYYPFLLYAKEGGIYALAHVRGGGEKGDSWYKGGFKQTKPNTWKDFIACTEYLIDKKYSSKGKIAIWSGSAGGITIGRAMTERPDLYNAVIIDRGMLNMERIEEGINGANSAKEFGTAKDSIELKGLLAMDSFNHLKSNVQYPATLLRVGINDSRVPPWHSFKFGAKLQQSNSSDSQILIKTEFDSGHGLLSPKEKEYRMIAESLSFAFWQTGHPDYQPKD
ncbi:prolyl oligopeptidase family serine peptidase [Aquimarina litoralis]|uniref:prolyl oligopeptidase n=1 Tax=Aquimarina litoralis TaxID=584605 RepID=A0ABP3TNA2_9FLAO